MSRAFVFDAVTTISESTLALGLASHSHATHSPMIKSWAVIFQNDKRLFSSLLLLEMIFRVVKIWTEMPIRRSSDEKWFLLVKKTARVQSKSWTYLAMSKQVISLKLKLWRIREKLRKMVRLSKRERQDKRELLSSMNQMNGNESKHEADNGESKWWLRGETNRAKKFKANFLHLIFITDVNLATVNCLHTAGGLLPCFVKYRKIQTLCTDRLGVAGGI